MRGKIRTRPPRRSPGRRFANVRVEDHPRAGHEIVDVVEILPTPDVPRRGAFEHRGPQLVGRRSCPFASAVYRQRRAEIVVIQGGGDSDRPAGIRSTATRAQLRPPAEAFLPCARTRRRAPDVERRHASTPIGVDAMVR